MASDSLRLRTILVSTRAALRTLPGEAVRICIEADALLAALEAASLNDGADPELLEHIASARRDLTETGDSRMQSPAAASTRFDMSSAEPDTE